MIIYDDDVTNSGGVHKQVQREENNRLLDYLNEIDSLLWIMLIEWRVSSAGFFLLATP